MFFHGIVNARRRANALISIKVDDVQVDGVEGVCSTVFDHFQNQLLQIVRVLRICRLARYPRRLVRP